MSPPSSSSSSFSGRPFQGINKVILLGTVGDRPKLLRFSDESCMAAFSVATNSTYVDKGETKNQVEWHSVVVRGKPTAEYAEKVLAKGTRVYVEGTLRTRQYTDPQGVQRRQVQVLVLPRLGALQVVRPAAARPEGDEGKGEDLF